MPPRLTIGPYTLTGSLGRGAFAHVHAAVGPAGERVALKVLQVTSDPRRRQRFEREVGLLRRLRHPGVVGLLDAGDVEGRPWLALPLVAAGSLDERLAREGPLPWAAVVDLGLQLVEALAAVHAAGALHRDLKPANVLCGGDGRYLLTDFGLVKDAEVAEASRLSMTGMVLGTPGFLAPEQARGAETTPATDVYGLGATLYAALTGEPPITGEGFVEVVVATAQRAPAPPSSLRPGVPPGLEGLVLACLAKRPEERPTLDALRAALERQRRGRPERRRRRRGRGPLLAALGLVLAAGVAGALVAAARRGRPAATGPDVAAPAPVEPTQDAAPTRVEPAPAEPPPTRAPGWRLVAERPLAGAPPGLSTLREVRAEDDGTVWVSRGAGIERLDDALAVLDVLPGGALHALGRSADGRHLFAAVDDELTVWSLDDLSRPPRRNADHPTRIHSAHPLDGSRIITADAVGTLALWDLAAPPNRGELHLVTGLRLAQGGGPLPGRSAMTVARTVEGQPWTVLDGPDDRLVLFEPGSRRHRVGRAHEGVRRLLPAGRGRFASLGADGALRLWGLDGLALGARPLGDGWSLRAADDGAVLVASRGGVVLTLDPRDLAEACPPLSLEGVVIEALDVTPDGRGLVVLDDGAVLRRYERDLP
ncbi:MAG: serine/threonine protein kinase [Planctomycetes bacterium]|nr:serine/threonine protein kinase [Planctomycetota bacterium]